MRHCEDEMGLSRFEDHITQDAGRMKKLKTDLRDSIKEAHSNGKSHEALKQALNKRGYDLKIHSNSGGVYGASIQAHSDQKTWKLSELQKGGFKSVENQLQNGVQEATKAVKPKMSAGVSPMSAIAAVTTPAGLMNLGSKMLTKAITKSISKGLEL